MFVTGSRKLFIWGISVYLAANSEKYTNKLYCMTHNFT